MPGVTAAVARQRKGFPRGFGLRIEGLINQGQVSPWQALAVAVVVRAVHVDGPKWLDTSEGADWCDLAGIAPGVLRRLGEL